MQATAEHRTSGRDRWRGIADFPLVALLLAIALFLVAAGVGQAIGSAVPLPDGPARLLVRNGLILAVVLATYKFAIARLGATPKDDLMRRRALPDLGAGVLLGVTLMASSVGIAALADIYNVAGAGDSSQLLRALVTAAIMPAFMEEILFRGILFRWIEEFAGSWAALAVTSALFGLAHILNPNATWFSSLSIAIEAGLLLGGAYMLTRSLWFPIGLHAAWNFTQGEVFGVPVSGAAVHGLVRARLSGPELLSGGGFGLEASVIALVIATITGVALIVMAARRGEVMQPYWRRPRSL